MDFDSAFNPTFGAQTQGTLALDPDNQAHTVSLMGQYNDGSNALSGRILTGQMSQDQALVTDNYRYSSQLTSDAVDAKVDLLGMNLKVVSKVSKDLRLTGSYDYYDRDNNTQVEEWTQISINNVNGKVAYNTPYDLSLIHI